MNLDFRRWLHENVVQPEFDAVGNHTKTGKFFDKFFQNVSRGTFGRSNVAYQHAQLEPHHGEFQNEMMGHAGNFDDHIAKSIPTYRESQVRKGHALATSGDGQQLTMLDIGGSEGSFAKAIAAYSQGRVQTTVLDPNTAMHEFFQNKSQVPGAKYDNRAFHQGWTEDDGTVIPAMNGENTPQKFDIIHEAMVFQFINNDRTTHFNEAKKLLKPGGLFVTEQKLLNDPEQWKHNEDFKDRNHKNLYYSADDLAAKQKIVGFQQDKKEEAAVGMVDNMISVPEMERLLTSLYRDVWQYWDSGNFKGYCASDDSSKTHRFVQSCGDMKSQYSTVQTPRKVQPMNSESKSFSEWAKKKQQTPQELADILTADIVNFKRMSHAHARQHHGPTIIQKAASMGVHLTKDDLENILRYCLGVEVNLLPFDKKIYDYHL